MYSLIIIIIIIVYYAEAAQYTAAICHLKVYIVTWEQAVVRAGWTQWEISYYIAISHALHARKTDLLIRCQQFDFISITQQTTA